MPLLGVSAFIIDKNSNSKKTIIKNRNNKNKFSINLDDKIQVFINVLNIENKKKENNYKNFYSQF